MALTPGKTVLAVISSPWPQPLRREECFPAGPWAGSKYRWCLSLAVSVAGSFCPVAKGVRAGQVLSWWPWWLPLKEDSIAWLKLSPCNISSCSLSTGEEPKISFAPVSSLDSLQGGLANTCLIVAPCSVHYQPPSLVPGSSKAQSCPKEQVSLFLSWLNQAITMPSPPGSVHPPAPLLTLCRCYLGEPNLCTDRLRFASGRGTKRARGSCLGRTSLRLHLQKDYAPAYFVRGCDFFFFLLCLIILMQSLKWTQLYQYEGACVAVVYSLL